jgi:phosphoserine phosphatase RsbX
METLTDRFIEWGVATLTLPGQTESGDRYMVRPFPDGVLVAVVDGVGHGDEAAAAAKIAVTVLETHSDESVLSLLKRCHEELRKTRGVVLSLASCNARDSTMAWLGVGNIEGRLLRADPQVRPRQESLVLRGGVVGRQLPPAYASLVSVAPGDTLIFATDGIRSEFSEGLTGSEAPQRTADRILAQYGKHTDDALVLVARYVGRHHEEHVA